MSKEWLMLKSDLELTEALGLTDEQILLFNRLSDADSKAGKLQRAVLALIFGERHFKGGAIPTSIRFLFYELIQGLVPGFVLPKHYPEYRDKNGKLKTPKRTPSQDVSDALTVLRELGIVSWDWIKDETRRLLKWRSASSVGNYLIDTVDKARINPWGRTAPPLILTESKSLAGVLEDIVYEYGCSIAATGGQCGGFIHTDIIPNLVEGQPVGYLGDEDNVGHDIERNTRRVIQAEVGELQWVRLALTPEQVIQHNIPAQPKTDHRYRNGGRESVAYETEALSQIIIQQILRDYLDSLLPEPLKDVRVREEEEREIARRRLLHWRNGKGK